MTHTENDNNQSHTAAQEGELVQEYTPSPTEIAYRSGLQDGAAIIATAMFDEMNKRLPSLISEQIKNDAQIKKALSDGFRHGSPESAKALLHFYNNDNSTPPNLLN